MDTVIGVDGQMTDGGFGKNSGQRMVPVLTVCFKTIRVPQGIIADPIMPSVTQVFKPGILTTFHVTARNAGGPLPSILIKL